MRRDWQIMLALAAITVAVFWPVTGHEFINFDDPAYVTANPMVQQGLTWAGVKWAFGQLHGEATYWHPVTWLSHMLDCQLYGLRPAGHHLTNLGLHTLNTLLLYVVLRRMTSRRGASAIVAALFALHPLQVDSVAWVAERKNLLSAFFFLLTIWAYGRYVQVQSLKSKVQSPGAKDHGPQTTDHGLATAPHPSSVAALRRVDASRFNVSRFNALRYYVLSLFLFALGLMSKPTLVPLPFVLLLLDYWPLCRLRLAQFKVRGSAHFQDQSLLASAATNEGTLRRLLAEKLPFFVLSAAASAVTIRAHESLGALASIEELSLSARLANATVAYALYLRKLLWPADLSVFYLHPGRWPDSAVVAGALLVLSITVLAVWQARRRPYVIVGWLWLLGMLVPVIGLVQAHVQALADRFAYLPAIGVFITVAWAAAEWMTSRQQDNQGPWSVVRGPWSVVSRPWAVVDYSFAALVLGGCVVMTSLQLRYWRNSLALLQHAVQVEPADSVVRVMLGNALFERRQLDTALAQYQEAARLRPGDPDAWLRAGVALTELGRPADAMPWLTRAGQLAPGWPETQRRLALALLRQGRSQEAREAYEKLVPLMPATAEGRRDLADMLAQGQQYAAAIRYYCEALQLKPDFVAVLNNLAMLRASCPQAEFRNGPEAVRLAEAACRLSGRREPNFLGTLAAAYAEAGRFPDAIKTIQEALDLSRAEGAADLVRLQTRMLDQFRSGRAIR